MGEIHPILLVPINHANLHFIYLKRLGRTFIQLRRISTGTLSNFQVRNTKTKTRKLLAKNKPDQS